jgi:hypothetical protein
MDDSKFNLWRASFSFCFVDGFLAPEEHDFIETKIKNLHLSDSQKIILMNDLISPPNFSSILPLITKPADRGFIVNHVRMLAQIDGAFSPEEKAKVENVKEMILAKLDMAGLDSIIAADEKASYHEDEVYKVDNKHSYVEKVVKGLKKLLNPGDYKFPEDE